MSEGIQVFDGDGFETPEHKDLLELRDLDHARRIIISFAGQIASLAMLKRDMREAIIKSMTDQLFEDQPELRRRIFHHAQRILKQHPILSQELKKEFR